MLPILIVNFFLFLSTIPLYGHNKICLSIHILMYIWMVSSLDLLQIKEMQIKTT